MTIAEFIRSRPFLFHLTHRNNIASIIDSRRIDSTAVLAERVGMQNRETFLSTRRAANIPIGNNAFIIRDQAQIKEAALRGALLDCTYEQYINLLNTKVFFWPSLRNVSGHFRTYVSERPRILRFRTADVFVLNHPPMFCIFNSGAPRPHPAYGGRPAPRGLNTFVTAENVDRLPSEVREVTFSQFCVLPETYWIAENPDQEFTQH